VAHLLFYRGVVLESGGRRNLRFSHQSTDRALLHSRDQHDTTVRAHSPVRRLRAAFGFSNAVCHAQYRTHAILVRQAAQVVFHRTKQWFGRHDGFKPTPFRILSVLFFGQKRTVVCPVPGDCVEPGNQRFRLGANRPWYCFRSGRHFVAGFCWTAWIIFADYCRILSLD